jgi:hypothetical protein
MRCAADRGGRGAARRPPAALLAAPPAALPSAPAVTGRRVPRPPRRAPAAAWPTAASLLAACLLAACSPGGTPAGPAKTGPSAPKVFRGPPPGAVRAVAVGGGSGGGFLFVPGVAGPSHGRPAITVPPIPPVSSGQPINLPLSTYEDVAGLQQSALADANDLLTQKCMALRGFTYSAPGVASAEEAIVQATEYGYGVGSLTDAASFGYGQPKNGPGSKVGPAFLGGFASFGDLAKQPPAWTLALLGFAPGARIARHQQPGCLQQAGSLLYGRGAGVSDPVPQIAIQASQWTQTDSRVLAVEGAWSRCMAARGFTKYHTPQQADFANWPNTPSATETATAIADVTCKRQVNLINTWLTVESAYQQVLIGMDLATLSQLQASFSRLLRRAEQLLTSPVLPGQLPPFERHPGLRAGIVIHAG